VILLNKADLALATGFDLDALQMQARALAGDAPVFTLSAQTDPTLDVLAAQLLPGETAALIGSSGVGKSTILNRLLGADRQRTSHVRAADDRGRHTTTTREMFLIEGGALLIDMPGLRELQLWADDKAIDAGFSTFSSWPQSAAFATAAMRANRGAPSCNPASTKRASQTTTRCGANSTISIAKTIPNSSARQKRNGR